jgi:hypothetical protein
MFTECLLLFRQILFFALSVVSPVCVDNCVIAAMYTFFVSHKLNCILISLSLSHTHTVSLKPHVSTYLSPHHTVRQDPLQRGRRTRDDAAANRAAHRRTQAPRARTPRVPPVAVCRLVVLCIGTPGMCMCDANEFKNICCTIIVVTITFFVTRTQKTEYPRHFLFLSRIVWKYCFSIPIVSRRIPDSS